MPDSPSRPRRWSPVARWRFRLRTLLLVAAVVAVAAGAVRWWYDGRVAEYERQRRLTASLRETGVSAVWTYVGPTLGDLENRLDGPAFRRPTHVYCDDVPTEAFATIADRLAELEASTLVVLARQIMPHVRADRAGATDGVIAALRRHRSLRRIVVDASIRGTPPEFDAPIYTAEDRALLEQSLPNLEVIWIEAN